MVLELVMDFENEQVKLVLSEQFVEVIEKILIDLF
jgi:hypothetical protein